MYPFPEKVNKTLLWLPAIIFVLKNTSERVHIVSEPRCLSWLALTDCLNQWFDKLGLRQICQNRCKTMRVLDFFRCSDQDRQRFYKLGVNIKYLSNQLKRFVS